MVELTGRENGNHYPLSLGYWIGIVSLLTAKLVAVGLAASNDAVPKFVMPFVDDPDHALLLGAYNLKTDHLPQGDFAAFLRLTGSGNTLRAIEQFVSQQYQSGAYAGVTYVLAATMNQSDAPEFEAASFFHDSWLTLALVPIQVADTTRYMLVRS
jgi:hypothetical protein